MMKDDPWLKIPAEDYEGHMSSTNVGQLPVLSDVFGKVIKEIHPESIMFLGCATGNGLEHLTGKEKIIGVDINEKYLDLCKKRFSAKLSNMKLICSDLTDIEFDSEEIGLVYAALIFEYVEPQKLLNKISRWLKRGGYLSVVLQLGSSTSAAISETEFHSLKLLSSIHKLIDPEELCEMCLSLGLREKSNYDVSLPDEKKFRVLLFQKSN